MKPQFTDFDDEIERAGITLTAKVLPDDHTAAPWDEHDGHGPVSDWTGRSKRPGEYVLASDGAHHRYYDFAKACEIALKDGWGVEGGRIGTESDRDYAARAADHDYRVMKAWAEDSWCWVGVVVTASKAEITLGHASCWGIESSDYPGFGTRAGDKYLLDVANELADEALRDARSKLEELAAA